jgi:hypothetical protein
MRHSFHFFGRPRTIIQSVSQLRSHKIHSQRIASVYMYKQVRAFDTDEWMGAVLGSWFWLLTAPIHVNGSRPSKREKSIMPQSQGSLFLQFLQSDPTAIWGNGKHRTRGR